MIIGFTVGGSLWAQDKPLKSSVAPHKMLFTLLESRAHHAQGLMVYIVNEIAADVCPYPDRQELYADDDKLHGDWHAGLRAFVY